MDGNFLNLGQGLPVSPKAFAIVLHEFGILIGVRDTNAGSLKMTITGLCTKGPRGPMLWLRDGSALFIETVDDLSEYYDLVVVAEGVSFDASFVLQTIALANEKPESFLKSGDR